MQSITLPAGRPDSSRAAAFIQSLPVDRAWRVVVEPYKARRSMSQNALLWAIYGDIIAKGGEAMAGWSKDDLHEFFLINHFGHEVREMFGRKRLIPLNRSSRLNKQEFSDLVESIVRFMAEQGVYVELPEGL